LAYSEPAISPSTEMLTQSKQLMNMRRAEHQVLIHVVLERERIGLLQPQPLARGKKRENHQQTSQDVSCDREARDGILFQDGIRGAAPCADENDKG
jgi:hypothetical protein